MRRIRPSEVKPQQDSAPIFVGDVTRQPLLSDSQDFTLTVINFEIGSRNRWHVHSGDQVLFVTYGAGYVADERQQIEIHAGDVVHVMAGEKHWHGATEHSAMSHISLTRAGTTTTIVE
ncbi:MAG TPA: cupin domain-containing protein [Chloroflexota bacterium]|nr:cupin domain-containing protein [Chloroflexota bacterium]